MIDYNQFKNLVLIPALQSINLYSEDAVALLLATMAQESDFGEYIGQEGGPAMGVFQMEPFVYNDIVINFLSSHETLKQLILKACSTDTFPLPDRIIYDLRLATIMARVFYERCPGALPDSKDIQGQWNYYKEYWNTRDGAATEEEFMANHAKYIKG